MGDKALAGLSGQPDLKVEDRKPRGARRRVCGLETGSAFPKRAAAFSAGRGSCALSAHAGGEDRIPVKMMARVPGAGAPGLHAWLAGGRGEDGRSAEGAPRWARGRNPTEGSASASRMRCRRVSAALRAAGRWSRCGSWGYAAVRPMPGRGPRPRAQPPGPDPARRDFTGPAPACRLAGGIARLRTGGGWLRLADAIDPCARMAVGRSPPDRMTADIAVAALESAKPRGHVAGNAVSRSDRGAQCTGGTLAEWTRANDARPSCSRTGNCHDNAVAESFFEWTKPAEEGLPMAA